MEAAPGQFRKAEAFQLDFSVSKAPNYTEERPVLYYERNGFVFEADLNLLGNDLTVRLFNKRHETFDRDWQVLLGEVQKQAEAELDKRRQELGDLFA